MIYQTGRAERPRRDDPRYDTEAEALAEAQRNAVGDTVYAVWRWTSEGEAWTLYLVYQGDTWRRE